MVGDDINKLGYLTNLATLLPKFFFWAIILYWKNRRVDSVQKMYALWRI